MLVLLIFSLVLHYRFKTVFGAKSSAWSDHASCIPVLPRCSTCCWFSIYTYNLTAMTLFLALLFIFALPFYVENGFTLSGLRVAWEELVQLCAIHGVAPHTRRCEFLSALSWSYQLPLYITRSCFCNSTHATLSPVGHTCCKFFPPVERVSSKRIHQGHVCHLFLILSIWLVIAPAIWKIFSFV